MTSRAYRHDDDNTYDTTPADSEKFAKMLEQSSLGSAASRSARLLGAEIAAEFSPAGATWLQEAPRWPDIAEVHDRAAEQFEAEGQADASELWLRAALFRSVDGVLSRRLGVMLEKTGRDDDACQWYLRAMEHGDAVATGRLAVMATLAGDEDVASLLVATGRAKLTLAEARRTDELVGRLKKAGKRHSVKLLAECQDDDLLFWTGCVALATGVSAAALTCFTNAAVTRGHDVAALALYDLTTRSQENPDELADVRRLAARVKDAVEAESTAETVPMTSGSAAAACNQGMAVPDSLVAAAAAGDREAATRLLTIIRPLVARYCRARLGTPDRSFLSADDVAQEVCLSVLTALPSYRLQGKPFLAFVYGIAAHKVIDAHRAASRSRSEPAAAVPDVEEAADGPEQRALRVELSGELGRLLDQLPAKQREILVLRVVVGLSAEETAEIVGASPGAVRVAQHRALARLRKVERIK